MSDVVEADVDVEVVGVVGQVGGDPVAMGVAVKGMGERYAGQTA
ncbi:hypothetical protein ACFQ1S_01645 [Kibdelosporangium lantanae]|uniref:Uncharacterized protein n=1 Tax=Kibdelosporangium lantanae TaxID=1497396 RepID=A0ABW3M1B1_9PSEU